MYRGLAILFAAFVSPVAAADLGRDTYIAACASCHGEAGRGDGPMTAVLAVPVPGLTTLSAGNGGAFPRFEVIHLIDGRSGLRGHGGAMPIYGTIFEDDTVAIDGPDGNPMMVSARLLALLDWLETLQQ